MTPEEGAGELKSGLGKAFSSPDIFCAQPHSVKSSPCHHMTVILLCTYKYVLVNISTIEGFAVFSDAALHCSFQTI